MNCIRLPHCMPSNYYNYYNSNFDTVEIENIIGVQIIFFEHSSSIEIDSRIEVRSIQVLNTTKEIR